MQPLDEATQTTIHEVEALIASLPTGNTSVKQSVVDDYHQLVNLIEASTGEALERFRVPEDEFKSSADRFAEVMGRSELSTLPKPVREQWMTPKVSVDVVRTKGNRLVAFFRTRMASARASDHHITISGSGNQTVVGIAGGSLEQSVTYKVAAGDDEALTEGLSNLGVDEKLVEQLAQIMDLAPDESAKKSGVRTWLEGFVSDSLSGTVSSAAASQLPSAVALVMGYLS